MSRTTNISWCQKSWNPITGCTKISPGCKHCYAETMAERLALIGGKSSARYLPVIDTETGRWTGDIRTWPEMLDAPGTPLRVRTPTTWFVGSMTDIFQPGVPFEFLAAVFAVMAACPQHRFMVLTKRPERMREFVLEYGAAGAFATCGDRLWNALTCLAGTSPSVHEYFHYHRIQDAWPLPNVAIGTSVENQRYADLRIPVLLDTPAHRRFLSCEPLLGPITVPDWSGIDMAIIGCESGKGRRETKLEWIQDLARSVLNAQNPCSECAGAGGWQVDAAFPDVIWQECHACDGHMQTGLGLHIKQADACPVCCGERVLWGSGRSNVGCYHCEGSGKAGKVRKDPNKPLDIYIPGYGTRTWREEMQW